MSAEHAQRFNWASLLAQNSSIQSKNTDLHLLKSRCITDSRVVTAERAIPERDVRVDAVRAGIRVIVGCFVAVRDFTDVSRDADVVKRFFTFVVVWVVARWTIVLSVAVLEFVVLRCFTGVALRAVDTGVV